MDEQIETTWYGRIPGTWSCDKINALYKLRNEKVSDKDFPPLSVTKQGVLPQLETAAKTDDHDNRKLVCTGDFAINSRSDRRGSCGISPLDGSVSLINTVLCPRNTMSPEYYNWLFHTDQFADEFYKWGHGIVDDLWTTGWNDMRNIIIPVPPLSKQFRIADFLDTKCSAIDSAIATAEKEIEKYQEYKRAVITKAVTKGLDPNVEMKDSRLAWIGTIPEHWDVQRGKYFSVLLQRPVQPSDGVITCFRDGEVTLRSNRREEGFTFADKEIGYQGIEPGDLVVHGMDGFAGAIGISDSRGKGSPVLNVIDTVESKPYLMYQMRVMAWSGLFESLATGIRVRSCDTSWRKLKNINFLLPPISEQQKIADYIVQRESQINALIHTKQELINKLSEYKKSLIYAYVTGKKEVPNE